MLSIYVHNSKSPGFLDIPDGTVLSFESITPAFAQEEGYGEFSLPIDLYWTENNRRILNFKERVTNFNSTDNFFICTVYNFHFPELRRAKLTLVGRAGSFTYRSGKFSISISGTRGLFAVAAKNKKLADLDLGIIAFAGMDSRQFAYWHYTIGFAQYPQIRFGPVGWQGFFDQERYDFNGEFLAKDTINNVVDLGAGNWTFGRPTEANGNVAEISTNKDYKDYRTIPFIRLLWLLQKVYEQLGFTATGACFSDGAFDDVVLFNNYSIENYLSADFTILASFDLNHIIDLKNHVPDMLCSDFLNAVLQGLGLFPHFIDDKNVELIYHKTDMSNSPAVPMDDILIDNFSADYLDGLGKQNGFRIALKNDEDDSYYTERVKDIDGKIVVATVNTIAELNAIAGGGLTTDDLVYVRCENMYYAVADATVFPVKWDAFAEALNDYTTGNGERQVDIGFSTMAQYVLLDNATGLFVNMGYLATRQKGTYLSSRGVRVKNKFGLRLFYCNKPGDVTVKPFTYNHNRDADNVTRAQYSFALQLADGLTTLHTDWQNLLLNAEVVKVKFIDNHKTRSMLKQYKKVRVNNVVFFIKKTEPQYPPAATILTELVPL